MPKGKGRKKTIAAKSSASKDLDEPSRDTERSRNTSRVFISYCHDPHATNDDHVAVDGQERQRDIDRHRLYVRDLSDYLRKHGVNCIIDQYYEEKPPESGWPRWMEKQIEESDFVLMVCSSSYYDLIRREERGTERGRGSQFEGRVIYGCLSMDPSANKFIPVFFGRRVAKQIPTVVAQSTSYQILFPLDMEMPEQKDLRKLYGSLVGENKVELPPLGEKHLSVAIGDGTREKDENDKKDPSHKTNRKESIPEVTVLSEQARRLEHLTAFDLNLHDSLEVSVKAVSNYFCEIECTHKDTLKLWRDFDTFCWETSTFDGELEGKRDLPEVHSIAELPMISKIQSFEMIADIKMEHKEFLDQREVDIFSGTVTGEACVECKLKTGERAKDTTPLCSEEDEFGAFFLLPKKCVHCQVHGEIHQASLTASIDNKWVTAVSLENIRTITKASITQQL